MLQKVKVTQYFSLRCPTQNRNFVVYLVWTLIHFTPLRVSMEHLSSTGTLNYRVRMLSESSFLLTLKWILVRKNRRIQLMLQHELYWSLCRSNFFWFVIKALKAKKQSNADNTYSLSCKVKGPYHYSVGGKKWKSRCSCFQLCSWLIEAFMQMKSALSFHLVHQMGGSGWKENKLLQVY